MRTVIAHLTARSAQLPSGSESRLVRSTLESGQGDRFAISFDPDTDEKCLWTIPALINYPADSEPYIKLIWYSETAGGSDVWRVSLQAEATDPVTTHEDMTAAQWDNDVWEEDITHSGGAGELQYTILQIGSGDYDDDAQEGDQFRIRIGRNADHANDTFDDTIYLVGAVLYAERSITADEFLQIDGDGQLQSSGYNGSSFMLAGSTLDDLGDVAAGSPEDLDFLQYSSGSGTWINTGIDGQVSLDNLSDVSISGAMDSDVLTYNSGSGEWTNQPQLAASDLDSLTDVAIISATDKNQLRHNGSGWINESYASGYSADDESSAYSAQSTEDIAKLDDLNALRVAYENLRAEVEALRSYLGA